MEPGNERTWPRQEWRRARIKGSDDGGAKKGGGSARISRAKNQPEAGLGPTAASVPQMSLNIYPELNGPTKLARYLDRRRV